MKRISTLAWVITAAASAIASNYFGLEWLYSVTIFCGYQFAANDISERTALLTVTAMLNLESDDPLIENDEDHGQVLDADKFAKQIAEWR